MFPLTLAGTVGRDWRNDPDDVAPVASALGDLGYVSALPAASSAGWAEDMDDAIRDYQTDRGLKVDGYMRPDGPTIGALNEDRAARQKEQIQIENPLTPLPAPAPRRQSLLNLDGVGDTPRPPRQTIYAATPEERALSNAGYTYRPDPMGRIGQGDWLDPSGNVLGVLERRRITASAPTPAPVAAPVAAPAAAPAPPAAPATAGPLVAAALGGFWQGFRRQVDAARHRAAGGEDVPGIALPVPADRTGDAEAVTRVAAAVNGALGELAVRRSLRGEPMSADDVGTVARAVLAAAPGVVQRLAAPGRIADLLLRRGRNIHVGDEERNGATSLAAVYRQARDAAATGDDPDGDASAETARQGQAAVGGTAWTARLVPMSDGPTDRAHARPYDPTEPAEHDDPDAADEHDALDDTDAEQPYGDQGDDGQSGPKPRGMNNPNTRDGAARGTERHKRVEEHVMRDPRKSKRWVARRGFLNPATGGYLRPDFTITINGKNYHLELKPDSKWGRIQGALKKRLYEHVTGGRVHVKYLDPSTSEPRRLVTPSGGRTYDSPHGRSLFGKSKRLRPLD